MNHWISSDGRRVEVWWAHLSGINLKNPEKSPPKNTASLATLRRVTTPIEALLHPDAVALAIELKRSPQYITGVASLAAVLAHVKVHDQQSLASRLGGGDSEQRIMKQARFRKLVMASEGGERMIAWRRAIQMVKGRANVAELATAWLFWDHPKHGELIKANWMYSYVGAGKNDQSDTESKNNSSELTTTTR